MSNFNHYLKQCRLQNGLSQKAVATFLEVSERAYQHYELGTREPNIDTLVKLADLFNVSLDYLCGRDYPTIYDNES